ncbi:MAG: DUF6261 family protein [Prevotellaceae bacterium]|jgi:hypothetical protein|nr:DUF6261 family protein [Prevotellaceae bacterium]
MLEKPRTYYYRNTGHLEFHEIIYRIFDQYRDLLDAPAELAAYKLAIERETEVINYVFVNSYTRNKKQLNRERKRVFRCLFGIVRIYCKHFEPTVRDAAEHLSVPIEAFEHLLQLAYDSTTTAIDAVLENLRSADYLPALQMLHLTDWVDELKRLNEAFKTDADHTIDEGMARPKTPLKTLRRTTDLAMRALAGRLTSLITINETTDYSALVRHWNVTVHHYNIVLFEHYGRLHVRPSIATAYVAPIAPEPYTGSPIFVIPELRLTVVHYGVETTVELLFGRDFTLTYEDNIEPGLATIFISGIGNYSGQTIVTFNIVS